MIKVDFSHTYFRLTMIAIWKDFLLKIFTFKMFSFVQPLSYNHTKIIIYPLKLN